MNHQDKLTVSVDISNHTEGRNAEFESIRSRPSNVEPQPIQPEQSSTHEKELSRIPKESDQILNELDIELEEDEDLMPMVSITQKEYQLLLKRKP